MDPRKRPKLKIEEKLRDFNELFSIFENPKDKFVQLMDMAKNSKGIKESDRVEKNKVNGCTSQAWVIIEEKKNDLFYFRADSDALIVKGLLSLLVKLFSGRNAKEIQSTDGYAIIKSIGLQGSISSQRTNGFSSAVEKIKELVT